MFNCLCKGSLRSLQVDNVFCFVLAVGFYVWMENILSPRQVVSLVSYLQLLFALVINSNFPHQLVIGSNFLYHNSTVLLVQGQRGHYFIDDIFIVIIYLFFRLLPTKEKWLVFLSGLHCLCCVCYATPVFNSWIGFESTCPQRQQEKSLRKCQTFNVARKHSHFVVSFANHGVIISWQLCVTHLSNGIF